MKTNRYLKLIQAFAFTACTLGSAICASAQSMSPLGPTGTISAFPTIVETGTFPEVTWDIKHPVPITEFINIEPNGSIKTKTNLRVEVRVLGASSQYTDSKGTRQWKTAEAEVKTNNGSWARFFRGTQLDVRPSVVCKELTLAANTVLNFRGRNQVGTDSSVMNAWWNTGVGGYNVLTLGDGALPPIWSGSASQRSPADFIQPYVDGNGYLALGPRDVIIFYELGGTSRFWGDRDTQDLVLLVTFNDMEAPDN